MSRFSDLMIALEEPKSTAPALVGAVGCWTALDAAELYIITQSQPDALTIQHLSTQAQEIIPPADFWVLLDSL